jgi:Zn-dependent metalloprotease
MQFRRLGILSLLGVCAVAVGIADAVTPHAHRDLEFPLEWYAAPADYETKAFESTPFARSSVLGENWFVQQDHRTGLLHMAYGGNLFAAAGIAGEADAVSASRNFLLLNSDLVGARENNMELQDATYHDKKWAVHFQQQVRGIPVYRGTAFVLMGESGKVISFGSDFFPEGHEVIARPALSEAAALQVAAASIGAVPDAAKPQTAELWLVPAPQGELMELTPAFRTVFETNEPFGKWETFVNAVNGSILSRRNFYHPVNVTGNVDGDVQNLPPSYGWCDGSAVEGLENLTVNVQGGNSDVTDANGDFDISHGGTSAVTITAQLLGPYSNINRYSGLGTDANFSGSATPGNPAQISWTNANSRQDERTTFKHANIVHDYMKDLDSNFTELDYAMPSIIGRNDGFCPGNAWWDGTGMNYCRENVGADRANTGELGNVIYHEFGHGVTQEVYTKHGSSEPVGDMHEGNSDVIANFLDRNPVIGLGFFLSSCTGGIRNADNSLQWPADNNGGHSGGQIIAGFHWDSWQSMLGAYSAAVADSIAMNNWHYARDMGRPQNQPSQVLWNFMMDDDNADLNDGTPNHAHYCLGATNHGFDCPEILTGVIINHTKLHHTTGAGPFDVVATITSTETSLDPTELKVFYRIDGGAFSSVLMSNTGTDEYTGQIPALGQDAEVDYYIFAADLNANTRTDPPTAPLAVHSFDVVTVYDDLESTSGWTIGAAGDNATTGVWELIDPIGTTAQPENDNTPAPGTLAFITGQCSGPNCSGGCSLGCNDIDGGTTTLLSPAWDLSSSAEATIKYDRWYSNTTGADPNNDTWVVDVSNDGGFSWTNVESNQSNQNKWHTVSVDIDAIFGSPGNVRLRFRASDLNSGSIVEAGVDEIRILQSSGDPTDAPNLGAPAPARLALDQNQPNPFRPETRISFAVPSRSNVELKVYNVSGQEVRTLVNDTKPAGAYDVRWDGRDAAGQRVASGVYFYRIVADGQSLTKKMTVMK